MSARIDDELSDATNKKHAAKFKLVFIGDQVVGKSSITGHFIKNEFDSTHNVPHPHPAYIRHQFRKQKRAGGEKAAVGHRQTGEVPLTDSWVPSRFAWNLVVYDITNQSSFINLHVWLDYIKDYRARMCKCSWWATKYMKMTSGQWFSMM